MAFNNWPYTNFQDLNLGWILGKLGVVERLATDSAASVAQYDARITANTNAIGQLGIELGAISDVAKVFVNSNLEAYYRGEHITGSELVSVLQSHGTLPYVEYNGEIYMLDTVSNAGDLRFSMGHTVDILNELVIRHIMIPAQSYNAAYSITNVSAGGGGSSNVVVFEISDSTCDHTYAELLSAWRSGKALVANIKSGSNIIATSAMVYKETVTQGGSQIDRFTIVNPELTIGSNTIGIRARYVYSNNTVSYGYIKENIATIDTIISTVNDGVDTNALLKTAQTLSAAEQAQVKQNLGISGGDATGAVLYDTQQSLTDVQKAQARDNIGAVTAMTNIPVTLSNGVYSTTMTTAEILNHLVTNGCCIAWNGLYFYPAGGTYSGPFGALYFECVWPASSQKAAVSVFQLNMNGGDTAPTIQRYARDININGSQPYIQVANAATYNLPSNTLVEFTGDSTALSISLATATDTDITHEYHFIFHSGSTPTTLTLPNTVRQPDGFTVEANHVYEVSILNNNMTAQGWAVTP